MILNRHSAFLAFTLLLFSATRLGAQENIVDADQPVPDEVVVPVSEQDLEASSDEAPVMDDEALMVTEFVRFKELVENGAYDEADTVAKRIIELAIKTKGAQSTDMAKALTNLAIVQHRTQQYDAAVQNYQSAIEIIEDAEDRLNEQLVNPLKGLAAAQLENGRPDLASSTYRRAVHVTHVNEGPHNLEQIDLLENLAEVHLRMGDLDAAKQVQDTIYAINIRAYDVDSLELVPALMRRAKWQHRAGFVYDERATYRRAIRIIEEQQGQDSLALVEPLVLLGRSFFFPDTSGATSYQPSGLASGEVYFKRALRIAAESPDSTWKTVADATLALGDYYMYGNNPQRARQVYRGAWDLLSESAGQEDKLAVRRSELEETVILKQLPFPEFVGETNPVGVQDADNPVLQGTVTMSYGISTRGRVKDLKLIETEPPEFTGMQQLVLRELRRRIFRPRFENGDPVDTPAQVLVHTFYYRQSDLDQRREAAAAVADEEEDS